MRGYNYNSNNSGCLFALFWIFVSLTSIFGIYHVISGCFIIFLIFFLSYKVNFYVKNKKQQKNDRKWIEDRLNVLAQQKLTTQEESDQREIEEKNILKKYNELKLSQKDKVENVYFNNMGRFDNMKPREFELEIAWVFEKNGFNVTITPQSNDGGKDAIMEKNGKTYLLECKKYAPSNKIGRPEIQKFYGVIESEKAIMGYFVTTSYFLNTAIEFAKPLKIELIDRDKLFNMSSQISHNDNVELVSTFCIKCEKIHEISPIDICRNEVNKIKCECGFEIQVIQSDYLNRRAYKKEPKKKEKKRN